jgi:hypothetical protein
VTARERSKEILIEPQKAPWMDFPMVDSMEWKTVPHLTMTMETNYSEHRTVNYLEQVVAVEGKEEPRSTTVPALWQYALR